MENICNNGGTSWHMNKFVIIVFNKVLDSYASFKAIGCLTSVCGFVCLFPYSSETAASIELKFLGMIRLGVQKVLG